MQPFLVHDNRFKDILGPNPTLDLLHENPKYAFAHEAGVFIPSDDTLFITSNHFIHTDDTRSVQISKVTLTRHPNDQVDADITELPSSAIPMGNGGVNTKNPDEAVIFCAQGSHDLPSGLYRMSSRAPHEVTPILTDFYGKSFNSVNDVVVARDGAIWFTDPVYGYVHNHRPVPSLPGQVYRFEPDTGAVRTLADGFLKPNGLCFSPDERTMYVTDTAQLQSYGNIDGNLPSSIYAFDVVYYHEQPFLINRRLFAMAPVGIPDGIKCDLQGNVYSGCGDGVTVWSPGGVLLGRILVEGGVANFCFGRGGEMFLLNEHRLWRAQLNARGALLGI